MSNKWKKPRHQRKSQTKAGIQTDLKKLTAGLNGLNMAYGNLHGELQSVKITLAAVIRYLKQSEPNIEDILSGLADEIIDEHQANMQAQADEQEPTDTDTHEPTDIIQLPISGDSES